MGTALELVYQYRQLTGKCESGVGLDLDEIELLNTIEALFNVDRGAPEESLGNRRGFMRERVDLAGQVRGRRLADPVTVVNLGPGGLVCEDAPYVDEGESVEIIIDDHELLLSYRFKGVVTWLRDDGGDFVFGIRFVGMPLLVRYGAPAAPPLDDELDLVAA